MAQDHSHTDYNYVGRDKYYASTATPPQNPESCDYFGVTTPVVGWIIEDELVGEIGGARSAGVNPEELVREVLP